MSSVGMNYPVLTMNLRSVDYIIGIILFQKPMASISNKRHIVGMNIPKHVVIHQIIGVLFVFISVKVQESLR